VVFTYLLILLQEWAQPATSSINLAVRLAYYFKPSIIATSTRKFFKHLALYKFTDFKLDISIIKNGYESLNDYKLQSLVLSLEQYSIFTFNGLLKLLVLLLLLNLLKKGKQVLQKIIQHQFISMIMVN